MWDSDGFCCLTQCPLCDASVYFVRYNGGSVWFDSLGKPWPKHICFYDDYEAKNLRQFLADGADDRHFGVVTEAVVVEPGKSGHLTIACVGGGRVEAEIETSTNVLHAAGSLVAIEPVESGPPIVETLSSRPAASYVTPPGMAAGARMSFEGQIYYWNSRKWCNARDNTIVHVALQERLDAEATRRLKLVVAQPAPDAEPSDGADGGAG